MRRIEIVKPGINRVPLTPAGLIDGTILADFRDNQCDTISEANIVRSAKNNIINVKNLNRLIPNCTGHVVYMHGPTTTI
jgi:hypothetical protein